MADINSVLGSQSGSTNQLDLLVQSYRQTEQPKLDTLNQKKADLQDTQTFYNNLYSKMNTLISSLDTFGDFSLVNGKGTFTKNNTVDDKFGTKAVTSSKTDVMTATASKDAIASTMSVSVSRLASNDTLVSGKLTLADSAGVSAGDHTLNIAIGDTSFAVKVTLKGTETNEELMKTIANAVNNTTDITVDAAYIKDTNTTGRLTFTSQETGSTHKVVVSGDNEILKHLGINNTKADTDNRTAASDTDGGYLKSDPNELDAKLNVNGINVTRDSNSFDDVVTGVTINLLKPQETGDQPVILTTTVDTKSVQGSINDFLTTLNGITSLINDNPTLNRSETSVSSLKYNIRGIASQKVASITDTNSPKYLTDIGVTIDNNGLFTVSDTDKLETYLKDDPQKVAQLFTAPDGIIEKVNEFIYNLQGDKGLIYQRRDSLTKQIDSTTDKINETQSKIDTQAESLKKQYTQLLQTYYNAMAQYNSYSAFSGGSTASASSGYSSLLG